ncbi:hypothetical protein [Paenibacillus hunanensis]|uniref:Uncharacterized protein n=1 Tax=Paenibacillus hunanensis TaxID=539262 RepID=A0ABU1J239_9BACL|nr:hypothetical protein [Paenibacillus hunanensis]MDR6245300.1 hypothetical protein [Paenibacillus hunanensis]
MAKRAGIDELLALTRDASTVNDMVGAFSCYRRSREIAIRRFIKISFDYLYN